MSEEKPNYYAILPANVRYDNELKDKAKILYAEICALSNKEGYCSASNKYFAELYNVSTRTITELIRDLVDREYIKNVVIFKKDSKEVSERRLYLWKKSSRGIEENFQENIINSSSYYELNINNKYKYNNYINNNNIIYEFIEQNYVRTISPLEKEQIDNWIKEFDIDLIKYAFEISIMNNKRNFNYVKAILKNWKTAGYKTIQDVKDNEKKKEEIKKENEKITEEMQEVLEYNWFDEEL